MAKSSKKSSTGAADGESAAAPKMETQTAPTPAISQPAKASQKAGASVKAPRKRSTPALGKAKAAGGKARKSPVAKKPQPAEVAISDDEIRLRAYFLAEQRLQNGVPGDSAHDWLEARRQLLAEAAARP